MAIKIDKIDLLDNRSELVQEVLGKKPQWFIRWGITLITVILSTLLFLTFLIRYPNVILARVTLTTVNPPAKLIARSNGTIKLFVSDNDYVDKDEIIAVISNPTNFNQALELIDTISNLSPGIITQIQGDKLIEYLQQFNSLGELQEPHNELLELLKEHHYNKLNQPIDKEIRVIRNQIDEQQTAINIKTEQVKNLIRQVELSEVDYNRNLELFNIKAIPPRDLEVAEAILLEVKNTLTTIKADIQNHRIQITELRKLIIVLTNADYEQKTGFNFELYSLFNNLISKISLWKQKYLLIAPISGKVALLDYRTDELFISENDYVASIIPEDNSNKILIRAKSPMNNSAKLKRGMYARIVLDGFPEAEYGSLPGVVDNISLLPKGDFYIVDIKLISQELRTTYGRRIDFKQEMQGDAELLTEDIRLIERVFYELRHIFNLNK